MFHEIIKKVIMREDLSENEAREAMDHIMDGKAAPSQIGGFLVGMRMKGEKVEEITGFARSMRSRARKVDVEGFAIDTCGTGGDGGKTFNISTAVAFVAAAGGVKVAKHGNKAVSSKSGSADVLEALGAKIDLEPEDAGRCIEKVGITFLFAPLYHSAMKNVAGPRKELGTRTVFNILGPLTNPASVRGQVLGVYDGILTRPLARVLLKLGVKRAMVVHGRDGLDEITTTRETIVSEVKDGMIKNYTINPRDFGIPLAKPEEIAGGDSSYNAGVILDVLQGKKGPQRDVVVLNSAAALYVGEVAEDLKEGVQMAQNLIDSGAAFEKLNEFIRESRAAV
ncbi:MAG TPA: anthranilate phosphoribosyltransferase [Thermoanaerobacterales bacterium]|nr:anthranilate phosphoribosyltransferase [Thermoanaerobacterales bacterium]